MVHLPIALQLFSVRDDMTADPAGTLKKIREFGYDGVEFAGLYGCTAAELGRLTRDAGLEPVSAHVGLEELLAGPEAAADMYAEAGLKHIVIPYLPDEYRPGTPGFAAFLKDARAIGEAVTSRGLTLSYHNHDFEFVKVGGEYGLDVLYGTVPAEYLRAELDVCWVKVGGADPVEYLNKYAGRAPLVHLKDFVGQKSENMYQLIGKDETSQAEAAKPAAFEFRPVGYGVQDFPAIIAAGEAAGATWFIVEQDMPSMGKTPLECAKMSVEYLRSLK